MSAGASPSYNVSSPSLSGRCCSCWASRSVPIRRSSALWRRSAAFAIFALSVAGSVFAAWLLWRRIRGRAVSADEGGDADEAPVSAWTALKGSLVIVAFFVAGCVAGLFAPFDMTGSRMSAYVLYALMFCVGVTLGNDRTLAERVRRLDPRLALLTDSLAVGAGFGYYSLSSIFIADLRGPELATIALLCNVMREIFTLLAAPLVARWCGPLAAVSIGGATTFDTTLPVITQAAGRPYAVVSIFHGCALDFSVPFLVTFFCTI